MNSIKTSTVVQNGNDVEEIDVNLEEETALDDAWEELVPWTKDAT